MRAALIEGRAPGGGRALLEPRLPLPAPWVVQIFPVYACNFRCRYCHFSIPQSRRPFVTRVAGMDMGLYKKCVDDMAGFAEKPRVLRFVGMGEPLLHKDLAAMIAYAGERGVAGRTELLTNASLLDENMADGLIEAGLNRLVVSLQGTSAAKYREISGVDLDFDRFVRRLRYFYERKEQTHVYLKIVDIALDGPADRQRCFSLFGDICDSIGVETAAPHYPGVADNDRLAQGAAVTQFGTEILRADICPQPFFTLQINPDGAVAGCYAIPHPEDLGDCAQSSVPDIWNGEKYNAFRRKMLRGRENMGESCRNCGIITYRMQPEDVILNRDGRLDALYGKK